MDWASVIDHPGLRDLPFKIELNAQGQVLMTPVKVYHSLYQGRIAGLLHAHLTGGEVLVECAIRTGNGTKVADVAWISSGRLDIVRNETECSVAPEICIEILSSANTGKEMSKKKKFYFASGATEVWICSEDGDLRFFENAGRLGRSRLAPEFPLSLYDA